MATTRDTTAAPGTFVIASDADLLTEASARTTADALLMPAVPAFAFASGTYVIPHPNTTTNTMTNNSLRLTPWFCPQALSIVRIGAEVTSAGESGSKVRLGIYADDGTGKPGNLLIDAGQIAGDSATVQEITLGSTLPMPRGWYWLGGAIQSAPTTQPTVRLPNVGGMPHGPLGYLLSAGTTIPAANAQPIGYAQASVTAGLPSTGASITSTNISTCPRLFFKLA